MCAPPSRSPNARTCRHGSSTARSLATSRPHDVTSGARGTTVRMPASNRARAGGAVCRYLHSQRRILGTGGARTAARGKLPAPRGTVERAGNTAGWRPTLPAASPTLADRGAGGVHGSHQACFVVFCKRISQYIPRV
ncbi:hypothetical protein PVAP13_3KG267668 [Panicum virgatum]|uniref:Uncharacterized protein n=1 Tax=Panicum virgatum TaxID=38727 RepID=A0A8T0V7P9_PANVG|nr:hypothetical protein PVAP13_3KG267668 [Panicum virgatum]